MVCKTATNPAHLKWNHQISLLSDKLSRGNGMSKIRHYVPIILCNTYYAIFSSLMAYESIIWGQSQNIHKNRIQAVEVPGKPGIVIRFFLISWDTWDCHEIFLLQMKKNLDNLSAFLPI